MDRGGNFCVTGTAHLSILDDGSLALSLTDALDAAGILGDVTVTRTTSSGPPDEPVQTITDYPCKGWIDEYSTQDRVAGDVLVNDRLVFIVTSTLSGVPTVNDSVTVGDDTFSIISVKIDPAHTCWVLQCRV